MTDLHEQPMRSTVPVHVQGTHEWGEYFHTVERYGIVRRQVIVYPPGIDRTERGWLRAWRSWPLVGVATALLIAVGLSEVVSPSAGLALGAVGAVVLCTALAHRARRTRRLVRSVGGIDVPGMPDPVARRRFRGALAVADDHAYAEEAWRRGELSRIEYEGVWHTAYDEVARLAGAR
jgi:hypothetical protein